MTGLIHATTAVAALLFGAAALCTTKGGSAHRWAGRFYVGSMLITNSAALTIFGIDQHFGAFHVLALVSLASVVAGVLSLRSRAPGRTIRHAFFITGSYIGLVSAGLARVVTYLIESPTSTDVLVTSLVTTAIGLVMMFRLIPRRRTTWGATRGTTQPVRT